MNMNANTQRQENYTPVSFSHQAVMPTMKPALVNVNLPRLNAVMFNLLKEEATAKSSGLKWKISYKNVKGQLALTTLGNFLEKGLPYLFKGIDECLNISEYVARLDALETLEAVYYLFKTKKATAFEKVTPAMIAEQRTRLAADRAFYSASPEWIVSYKARIEAAFESKDIKLARRNAFNAALKQLQPGE